MNKRPYRLWSKHSHRPAVNGLERQHYQREDGAIFLQNIACELRLLFKVWVRSLRQGNLGTSRQAQPPRRRLRDSAHTTNLGGLP
jgi:hypothetical protein